MTIRDYLKRRIQIWMGTVVLIALVAGCIWYLGFIGAFTAWWPAMLVVFGALVITNWAGAFAVRCPVCALRLTGDIYSAMFSKRASRRFNYCPGCGVKLEEEWRDPKRL